jgi:hypothetical protein
MSKGCFVTVVDYDDYLAFYYEGKLYLYREKAYIDFPTIFNFFKTEVVGKYTSFGWELRYANMEEGYVDPPELLEEVVLYEPDTPSNS